MKLLNTGRIERYKSLITKIICLLLAIGFSSASFLWTFMFGRTILNTEPEKRSELRVGRRIVLCSDLLSIILVVVCLIFVFI